MRRLLTIILLFLSIALKAQTLHFHQLTVKDGLLHNGVITLAQDAKGDIWVATHGGLLRYDGRQFYKLPFEELPDKRVDRINRAQDGTMWVQCFERHKQVSRYDTLTHHFVTYNVDDLSDSLRQQAIQPLNRTFADTRSARVWTIEKRQLWQTDTLRPDAQFAYTGQTATDAGLKDETFYSLLLDRSGILWAGSANNGLYFADTHQNHYRRLVCQPLPLVRATHKDRQGTLWIAISDQQLLTLAAGATATTRTDYPMTDSVEGRRVRAFVEDGKGRLWMGAHDGLYVKTTPTGSFSRVTIAEGETTAVFCLCNDGDKRLWIGTDRGLYRLNPDDSQRRAELIDSTVTFIGKIATGDDRLWIANERGLYCHTGGKTTCWYEEATHAVVTDPRGQTWVGTDDGLLRVTPEGLLPVSTAADGHTVKNLICWRDFLWCSYNNGLCCVNIYTGQATTIHTEYNEYLDGSASVDPQTGTLYFGGTMGIDCLPADSLDEQLRSGTTQLWLEEVNEELRVKSEAPDSPHWPYAVALLVVGSAAIAGIYFMRRKKQNQGGEPVPMIPQESIPDMPSPTLSQFVQKATAIAKAHIADADFTAEQMAQELAMSRTKLFLLMKREAGKGVMEFVRDIRLDYAAEQLQAGTPINEIYMACGFSDPSSFRRSFVKKFGIKPSQYKGHKGG